VVLLHWVSVDGIGRLVGIDLRAIESDDRSSPPQPVNTVPPNLGVGGTLLPAPTQVPVPRPFAGLTSTIWRKFSFRNIDKQRAAALEENGLLERWDEEIPSIPPGERKRLGHNINALRRRGRRGPGLPDEHFVQVAEAVVAAKALGDRKTLQAIQAAFPGEHVSRDMANYWRKRAQELGLLPPPVPRRRSKT
jgi:hypothetical protein